MNALALAVRAEEAGRMPALPAYGFGGVYDELIAQGVQFGAQYAAGKVQQSRASGAVAKQLGAQFENLAGQVTRFFNQVQSQPVITQADAEAAIAAYQQLAQLAAQSGTEYVTQQWESEHYKPAYEARLRQIVEAVGQDSGQWAVGSGQQAVAPASTGTAGGIGSMFSDPLMLVALALLGIVVLKR